MLERQYSGPPPAVKLPAGAIDTQMHMYLDGFPAAPGGPGLPPAPLPGAQDYRTTMRWLGIDRVVITQANAHQHQNDNLLACLAAMGACARGVAVITADTTDAQLRALAEAGVVGARIMDLPGGAVGLDQLEDIDARASSMDWMMAVQFDGSNLIEHAPRLAKINSRWVLDHHGKFFGGITPDSPEVDAVKRLIDGGRCWFKFAGCYESSRTGGPDYADVAAIARVVADYAPERIVWGSNWPHNMMRSTEDYPDDARLMQTTLGWLGDEHRIRMALVDNPEVLYGFPPWEC